MTSVSYFCVVKGIIHILNLQKMSQNRYFILICITIAICCVPTNILMKLNCWYHVFWFYAIYLFHWLYCHCFCHVTLPCIYEHTPGHFPIPMTFLHLRIHHDNLPDNCLILGNTSILKFRLLLVVSELNKIFCLINL